LKHPSSGFSDVLEASQSKHLRDNVPQRRGFDRACNDSPVASVCGHLAKELVSNSTPDDMDGFYLVSQEIFEHPQADAVSHG
jgi:hypothetical protein